MLPVWYLGAECSWVESNPDEGASQGLRHQRGLSNSWNPSCPRSPSKSRAT